MFELVVKLKDRMLSRSQFDQDEIRIGRAPESELFIDNAALSRLHATIRRQGAVYTLEDKGSVNGTYVNGKKIQVWNLSKGDQISIGKFTITFTSDAPSLGVDPASLAELKDGGGTIAITPKTKETPAAAEQKSPLRAYLTDEQLRRNHRIEADVFHVGSETTCDIVLGGWFTPKRVALIARGHGGFTLVNVAGRPLFVNGQHVEWKSFIREGDLIDFGSVRVRFHRGSPVEGAPLR